MNSGIMRMDSKTSFRNKGESSSALLAILECFVKFSVAARQRDFASINKKMSHMRTRLQQISIRKDKIRYLPGLDGPQAVRNTHDLSRVKSDSFECFFLRQTKRRSHTSVKGKVANS